MATNKQITANRTHALASTGSNSAAAKALVGSNATKLGVYSLSPVVDGMENEQDWDEFRIGILHDLAPVGALELVLTERVAGCLWRKRRVTRFESDLINSGHKDWLRFATHRPMTKS